MRPGWGGVGRGGRVAAGGPRLGPWSHASTRATPPCTPAGTSTAAGRTCAAGPTRTATGHPPTPAWSNGLGRLHFDSETAAETVLYAAAPYLVLGDTASTFSVEALDRPTATLTIHGTGPAPL
ncbi:hypothetical protein ACFQ1I_00330 [Kitasatospora arboriphila]